MANTYHQVYIHAVFAVKFRHAVIETSWEKSLFSVIANLIKETGCKPIIVNGRMDHVHCLFGLKPTVPISDVMKNAKAKSSKWINESRFYLDDFAWQEGYGVFTYSHKDIGNVFNYIANQERHHQKLTFHEEYVVLLKEHGIEYDDQYVFGDLI